MKKLDSYIFKKFFTTFFFSISLILIIAIIFDISEKIDDFLKYKISKKEIINYYLDFIPYFGNLFSHLFVFISVIFFTSRMANNSEIIAIMNSGISFKRFLMPFFATSLILAFISFMLGNFIIPPSNNERIDFENKYLTKKKPSRKKNIHMQILPEHYIYMQSFNKKRKIGYKFTLEKFKNGKLISKLKSDYIKFDTINQYWEINNYKIREFKQDNELIKQGKKLNISLNLHPDELDNSTNLVETMNYFELNKFIKNEKMKGSENITFYEIEKHKRIAFPFASIILTIIGVCISNKKTKGKIGFHLGIGILIAFTYIMLMQISTTFSINSNVMPYLAVWTPNIIFSIVACILVYKTSK
mgnify:FL=1